MVMTQVKGVLHTGRQGTKRQVPLFEPLSDNEAFDFDTNE